MLRHHETDKLFKDNINDFEVKPPDHLWNNISNTLDQQKKSRLLFPIWFSIAAGVAIIVGLFGYFNQQTQLTKPEVSMATLMPKNDIINNRTIESKSIVISKMVNQENFIEVNSVEKSKVADVPIPINEENLAYLKPQGVEPFLVESPSNKTLKTSTKSESKPKYLPIISNQWTSEVAKTNNDNDRISLSAMVAPTYSYRTTSGQQQSNNSSNIGFEETGTTNLSGGMNLQVKTNKRWRFETGVFMTQSGQNISTTESSTFASVNNAEPVYAINVQNNNSANNNSMGRVSFPTSESKADELNYLTNKSPRPEKYIPFNDESTNGNGDLQQNLKYIELPLAARYNVYDKKTTISISAGLCANFLIDNEATLKREGQNDLVGETENIEPISYSSKVGIGFEYPFLSKISINVEPVFRYFISSVNQSGNIKYRPYSMGINAGLSYKF